MSTSPLSPGLFEGSHSSRRQLYAILMVSAFAAAPLLIWLRLAERLLATNFLPHLYCYLKNPALAWTHVVADAIIGIAYLAISVTLGYLVHKARRDIPFSWVFLAFGLFIVACGGTHLMEAVTVWVPLYWLSVDVKIVTALASLATAISLPRLVPKTISLLAAHKEADERKLLLEEAN